MLTQLILEDQRTELATLMNTSFPMTHLLKCKAWASPAGWWCQVFGGPEKLCKSPGVSQNLPSPLPLLPDHSSIVCVYLKAEAVSLGQYQDLQSAQSRDPLPRTGQHGAA